MTVKTRHEITDKTRVDKIMKGLTNGKTYTEIAEDIGISRRRLYAIMRKENVQELMLAELEHLDTKLLTWIDEDRQSKNPSLRKNAVTELAKYNKHLKDKLMPTLTRTENITATIDLTKLQQYQQTVNETLNRLPPNTRNNFWNTYNQVQSEHNNT